MAEETLSNPVHELAVKHCVILSDGDLIYARGGSDRDRRDGEERHHLHDSRRRVPRQHRRHADETNRGRTKGNFYPVNDPRDLPAIYTRETRQVSRSFLLTEAFTPLLRARSGPAAELAAPLPPLHGFVRTTLKPGALPVMAVEGPRADASHFPILAYWQPGAGRAVAFTSDAREWARDWAVTPLYARFWTQAVEWSLRSGETGRASVFPEVRDGRVRLVVDVRDEQERPLPSATLKAFVSPPRAGAEPPEVTFTRAGPGRFEASFPATEAGAYFVNVRVCNGWTSTAAGSGHGAVLAGVRGPGTEPALLRHLAELTGGEGVRGGTTRAGAVARGDRCSAPPRRREGDPAVLVRAGARGRPAAGVRHRRRRLAIDPGSLWVGARAGGTTCTRHTTATASPGLDRLLEVKQTTAAEMTAARRSRDATGPPRDVPPPPPPRSPPPAPAPPPLDPAESGDYLDRLRKAKERGRKDDESA